MRNRTLLAALLSTALAFPAQAQVIIGGGGPAGNGSGTITGVTAGAGLAGGGTSGSVTLSLSEELGNSGAAITGTTYSVDLADDMAKQLLFTGSSDSAWDDTGTATSGGFDIVNAGTATVTWTPSDGVDGGSTIVVQPGLWAHIFWDGSTWRSEKIPLASSSQFGAVKVDGSTITESGGVISAAGGSGTVNSGTSGNVACYASTGTVVGDCGTNGATVQVGQFLKFNNSATGWLQFGTNSRFSFDSQGTHLQANLNSSNAAGPQMTNSASSATVPGLVPNKADATTGIGAQASGNLSIIVGGAEKARADSNGLAMQAGVFTLKGFTVSGLPASPATGSMAYVTDQTAACSYGATPAGSGSNVCKVWYNGTAWVDG